MTHLPLLGHRIKDALSDECTDRFDDQDLVTKCMGYAGVYRVTFVTTTFFILMSVASSLKPSFNRQVWPAKYSLCALFLLATFFIPNSPLFFGSFLWMARLGACLFLVIQQIILIDLAYSWNESWLQKSYYADSVDYGTGQKWLTAIVVAIALLYLASFSAIVLLYREFSGCAINTALITITLILIFAVTGIQLTGEEGNLLTSAVMSLYAVYLVGSAISHNPDGQCNPFLGKHDTLSVIVGLILTFISLVWTGWSWTDERVFTSTGMKPNPNQRVEHSSERPLDGLDIPMLEEESNNVTGVVMEQTAHEDDSADNEFWKLNLLLALISSWITVTLTGWGSVRSQGGTADLWFITVSQFMALGLYTWTLVAPRFFPDRDFS